MFLSRLGVFYEAPQFFCALPFCPLITHSVRKLVSFPSRLEPVQRPFGTDIVEMVNWSDAAQIAQDSGMCG